MAENKRHQVVVIGSGFGGLFGTKALKRADVDVTMIAKTTHHLFQPLLYQVATGILSQGEIAPPTREILADQDNARVLLGTVTGIDMESRVITSEVLGPGHHHAVRLADRGRRRRAVLLRQRPLRRARARHEEHRRRPRAARSHLRCLRARRAGRDRGGDRAPADLRRRRRRPDRGRDGRADRRAGPPHPAQGLPQHQHPRGQGHPARRRRPGAAALRRQAGGVDPPVAGEARRHRPPRRDGHRPRRVRHRRQAQGRLHRAHRGRHQGVGRGCAGVAAGHDPGRAERRPPRPRRPDRREPRPDAPRPPRGVRRRRHDLPRQPARRRAGRDPGREVRRQGDQGPGRGQPAAEAVQVLRQGLDGDDLPLQRGGVGRAGSASPASSPG